MIPAARTARLGAAALVTALAGLAFAEPTDTAAKAPADTSPHPAQQAPDAQPHPPADAADPAPKQAQPRPMAYLGVVARPLGPGSARQLGLVPGSGLRLIHVEAGSAAQAAGLEPGDVLVGLNDQQMIHPQQLSVLIGAKQPGDTVTLRLLREGEPLQVQAQLGGKAEQPRTDGPLERRHLFVPPLEPLDERGLAQRPGADGQPNDAFEQMRDRMHQQHEQMQQMMDQLRRQMRLDHEALGPLPGLPGIDERWGLEQPAARAAVRSNIIIDDGEHRLQLRADATQRHLTVKTAEGELLFDGAVPEGGQIQGLDPHVQDKVDRILSGSRIQPRWHRAPARPAEPKGPMA